MKTQIMFNGVEHTFITDSISMNNFIRENKNEMYACAIITPDLAKGFDHLDYIDVFRLNDEKYCYGHGSTDRIPYIIVPNVYEMEYKQKTWYELHIGEMATKDTLERLIKLTQELIENY